MTIATAELTITGMNFPPYSTRTATQTLAPIDAATSMGRTVNGVLIDLSDPDGLFRQFKSTITGNDMQMPEFNWPGEECEVHCIVELAFKTGVGDFIRNVVPGSIREDGDYTFYRPVLIMRVIGWSDNRDDWNAANQWSIDLEESEVDAVTETT